MLILHKPWGITPATHRFKGNRNIEIVKFVARARTTTEAGGGEGRWGGGGGVKTHHNIMSKGKRLAANKIRKIEMGCGVGVGLLASVHIGHRFW